MPNVATAATDNAGALGGMLTAGTAKHPRQAPAPFQMSCQPGAPYRQGYGRQDIMHGLTPLHALEAAVLFPVKMHVFPIETGFLHFPDIPSSMKQRNADRCHHLDIASSHFDV